jgi:hypothetical protein
MASIALTDTAQLRSSLQEARDQRAVIVAKIKDFKSKLDASQAELDAIDKTIPLYEELVRIKRESVDAPVRLVKAPVYKEDDSDAATIVTTEDLDDESWSDEKATTKNKSITNFFATTKSKKVSSTKKCVSRKKGLRKTSKKKKVTVTSNAYIHMSLADIRQAFNCTTMAHVAQRTRDGVSDILRELKEGSFHLHSRMINYTQERRTENPKFRLRWTGGNAPKTKALLQEYLEIPE